MSPIPETVKGTMFQDFEGKKLVDLVTLCFNLSQDFRTIETTPKNPICIDIEGEFPPLIQHMWLDKAFLVQGPNLLRFLGTMVNESPNLVPRHWTQLENEYPLLSQFGVTLKFDEQHQILEVHRKNSDRVVLFEHDVLMKNFDNFTRTAIAGLAVLPDELWGIAAWQGLIIGKLKNHIYQPWNIDCWSIMLNDPEGVLSYKRSYPTLQPYTPNDIYMKIHENHGPNETNKAREFIRGLRPVGLFADRRER